MGAQVNPIIRQLFSMDIDVFYPLFEKLIKEELIELKGRENFFLLGDYSRDRVVASLGYFRNAVFGAFDGSDLIGFIWGNNGYAGLGFISWLMVDKAYRGKGVAAKLLKKYEEYILAQKGHVIELYCFERLEDFYLNQGYEHIGVRRQGYFKLRQIIMNKYL